MFITAKTIKQRYDVSNSGLRNWAESGKVQFTQLPGGKHLYHSGDIERLLGGASGPSIVQRQKIVYARVSSSHQKEDLQRQVELLSKSFPDHRVISDIGSGLNFQRKGLRSLLDLVFSRSVEEVVVAYRDRLCRFGFELLEDIFKRHEVRIVVHSGDQGGPEEELSEDLLAIVNFFVARNNGRRSSNQRKKRRLNSPTGEALPQPTPEEPHQEMARGV